MDFSRIGRKPFWELCDEVDKIEKQLEKDDSKIECYQLDNFLHTNKLENIIVCGAGMDGKKVVRLLNLLGKRVSFWCDKNLKGSTIDGIAIVSIEEMTQNYTNDAIIIASRKYRKDIVEEILAVNIQMKKSIFLYDYYLCHDLRQLEFRKKEVLSYPPLWLTIGVTSACSNQCLFCAYHGEAAKGVSNVYGLPLMLQLDKFKKMVDMAKEGGVPEIHICGTGEPFFNPSILSMIDYTIDKYGEVSLQTEFGKKLFEKNHYLDEIIKREKHITYIATDVLSSIEQEHNRIKQGASYKELLEGMEYLGKRSSIVIRAAVILTKQNYKNIKGIIDDFVIRNVNLELWILNLLSYDYSDFTSSDNVYTSRDIEITEELLEIREYAKNKHVKAIIPSPADSNEEECFVFWDAFQMWPVSGCVKERYAENMIPHACAAVVRGELNSLGYLFDYDNIMDAWNNKRLVEIRGNIIKGKYPSEWCKKCFMYNGEDSYYRK